MIILIHILNRNKMTKEFHVCEVAVELLSSPPLLLAVPFISVSYQTQTRFDYLFLFVRFAVTVHQENSLAESVDTFLKLSNNSCYPQSLFMRK